MKLAKNSYKAVFIKWNDSTSWKRVWWQGSDIDEEAKRSENDYFWTHAYLLKETKRNYILANSVHFEDGKAVSFAQLFTIPKGCVEQIREATFRNSKK